MKTYLLFALTLSAINIACILLMGNWIDTGATVQVSAASIVRPDYENIPTERITTLGGQLDILDERRRVVFHNEQPTDLSERYTAEQLLERLYDRPEERHKYTLVPFQTFDGKSYSLLLAMPKQHSNFYVQLNLVLLLLFGIAVYIYSRWTARRITGPLEMIAKTITRMRDGHYGERMSFVANEEFNLIQDHFNEMSAHLERSELENKRLMQSKQQMMLDLSHDLKTPVTTIQGYAKALHLGFVDSPDQQARYLKMIYDKSVVVTSLVDDMFQLAMLDSEEYPFAPQQGDFAEFIRHIAIDNIELFENKGQELVVDIPNGKIMLRFHTNSMYRAVSNLLSNACKHNPPGTVVTLELIDAEQAVRLHVSDNGSGIPQGLRDVLFEPFVRGDESRQSSGGTGLGLAIAKKAIERHGGQLKLVADQGGTSFQAEIPKSPHRGEIEI
ncbi:sensor histidine kinase [Paenibacillus guangzhouensis]|uniref:sensor histidine kinase n=1 Tax=Paenibacillus guangzhouensis TaxID=1473112 RepID=UPI001266E0A4|nr:HAMP domain-containing sensor histidine kinase [Paenibacillus guangzhouensis]